MELLRPVRTWRPVGWVCALLLVATSPGHAHAADGLSLSEAVSRALQDGFGAKIARLVTGQATDKYSEKRGAYLPQLFVTSGAGTSNRRDERLVALNGNFEVREYGLAALASDEGWLNVFVEQLVFDMHKWKVIEREKLTAEVAKITEREEREKVAYDVTTKFADLVRLQRLSDQAQAEVEQARWLDSQTGTLHEAGRALDSERELVALHLVETELQASSRNAETRAARDALWSAISGGEPAGAPWRVDDSSLPVPTLGLTTADAELAVTNAPAVQILEMRRRVEESRVGEASAKRLPTLGFRAGYSHYGTDRFDLFEDEVRVGIDLKVPIFDGFQAKNAIRGAVKGVEIARLRHRSLLNAKRNKVRELTNRLQAAEDRLQLARRRAASSAERMRLTDLRLKSERASLEEALAARERSMHHRQEATNAYFTRFDVWTALQHEMGLLSSAVMGPGSGGTP